jgi:hypothetical protein
MSDEPPDYIDWGNDRSGGSFFGCLGMAIGFVFMLTGGLCVWSGFRGLSLQVLLIGLVMMVAGWLMSRRR